MEGSLEAVTRGMAQDRKAVFERVWQRVMHSGAAEDVPLEESLPAVTDPGGEAAPALPAPPPEPPGGDFPRETGVLGENCRDYAGLLQSLIREALTGARRYQALARRAGGTPGRVLTALGGEETRRAKELSAACFLITGVRYWPEPDRVPPVKSYLGSLRRLFRREQETVAASLAAVDFFSSVQLLTCV